MIDIDTDLGQSVPAVYYTNPGNSNIKTGLRGAGSGNTTSCSVKGLAKAGNVYQD